MDRPLATTLPQSSLSAGRILGAFNALAYISAMGISFSGLCPTTTLAAILLSAPEALSIASAFNPSLTSGQLPPGTENASASGAGGGEKQRPYRLEGLVVRVLKHAPGVVLAVFADTLLREAAAAGTAAAAAAGGGGESRGPYWGSWLYGAASVLVSTPVLVRCLPLVPFVYMFFLSSPGPRPPPPSTTKLSPVAKSEPDEEAKERARVVVAGGGVGGLVLGACLQEIGLPFEVCGSC